MGGRRSADWQATLAVQAAALQICWVAARLMIAYRAIESGSGTALLGVIAAAYAAPAMLMAFPAGRWSDRVGGLRLTAIGIVVQAAAAAGAAFTPNVVLLLAASVVLGVGQILIVVGQQSYVAENSVGRSDSAFGMLTSAISIGQMIGPPGIAWVSTTLAGSPVEQPDTTTALLVLAGLALLVLPVNRLLRRAGTARPDRPVSADPRLITIVRTPGMWRALLVSGVILTGVDLVYAFLPVWAVDHGVTVTTVGWLLALRALITVFSRVGLGRLVTRFGRKLLLLVALALAGGGLLALAFVGQWGAIGAMIALGVGLGLPQPLTMSWVAERSDPANRGAALGLRLTVNRLFQILMPLTVGVVAAPFGVGAIFLSGAVLMTGMTAVVATAGNSLDQGPPPETA